MPPSANAPQYGSAVVAALLSTLLFTVLSAILDFYEDFFARFFFLATLAGSAFGLGYLAYRAYRFARPSRSSDNQMADLGPDLPHRPDSNNGGHGFIELARPMTRQEYDDTLARTHDRWHKLAPPIEEGQPDEPA